MCVCKIVKAIKQLNAETKTCNQVLFCDTHTHTIYFIYTLKQEIKKSYQGWARGNGSLEHHLQSKPEDLRSILSAHVKNQLWRYACNPELGSTDISRPVASTPRLILESQVPLP